MAQRDPHEPVPGQMALMPEPARPTLLWPTSTPEAGGATWSRYTGKTRQQCTTCLQVLMQHDREPYPHRPPPPAGATMVRTLGTGRAAPRSWHCSPHGTELERLDQIADRQKRLRREHGEHLARATHT